MAAVFAGAQTYNGGFRADQLTLKFGGTDVAGFLVQQVQFSYTQQVTLLYEIGSANVYFVGGRAQGTAQLGRVVGPAALGGGLMTLYKDLCDPQDISLNASSGCSSIGPAAPGVPNSRGFGGNGGPAYLLEDAVMTTVSASVTSQDVVVNEQLAFMFVNLSI